MNLLTRIDEGMTDHDDVVILVMFITISWLAGFVTGYLVRR